MGNRLSQTHDDGAMLHEDSYTYANNSHRLLAIDRTTDNQPSGIREFVYDAAGNRIAGTADDGSEQAYNYNHATLREYVYLDGQAIAFITNGQIHYIHNDHLGTPQVATDQNQQVVWMGDYQPFGKVAANQSNSIELYSRFPGQYFDEETGLHYNYFRDYDPAIGRYIQSDPIGLAGGINTYGYAFQNSLKHSDFFGLAVDDEECFTVLRVPGFAVQACRDNSRKKKNKQKREQKQLDDFCKEYNVDRRDFGDFLERWKIDNGFTGEDTLSWDVLKEVLKDYRGF